MWKLDAENAEAVDEKKCFFKAELEVFLVDGFNDVAIGIGFCFCVWMTIQ